MWWRLVLGAALLLLRARCQDDNEFYFPHAGVERSYAQLQPALLRPEHGDTLQARSVAQHPDFGIDAMLRLPSPGYNQHPQPFRAPHYLPHPAVPPAPHRVRYRPLPLHNYQLLPAASTERPDPPQIHSLAYQNDPSKPETFLGQITLNNPDIDYLQNNRFKPFDENSLKSNGQSGHISHDEDIDDDQDIFDHYKVTTYNPVNRGVSVSRQRLNNDNSRPPHLSTSAFDHKTNVYDNPIKKFANNNRQRSKAKENLAPAMEQKSINLALEPLLEDDISDISSFRELMKNHGSTDVEVINSNSSEHSDIVYDSKPDASFMSSDNLPNIPVSTSSTPVPTTILNKQDQHDHDVNDHGEQSEEVEGEGEYVEYYDDESDDKTEKHPTETPFSKNVTHETDIYDEYDSTDEPDDIENVSDKEQLKHDNSSGVTESFDVLVMTPNNTMVRDDNFKQFVDTVVIDQTDFVQNKQLTENKTRIRIFNNDTQIKNQQTTEKSREDNRNEEFPSVLGHEVVSVVTTKSVINGTISIPEYTYPSSTPQNSDISYDVLNITNDKINSSTNSTTENYFVVASVQTSRSVSGARFLPFPTIEEEDKKQVLNDSDEGVEKEYSEEEETTKEPDHIMSTNVSSTENINDKLDSIQSELSSAVLSGSLDKNSKNIELITESQSETTTFKTTITTTTTPFLNVFTLKSTQSISSTEKSAPEPPPVMIKKFTPRVAATTTPKPKKKLVTVMDELPSAFLPPGYKPRLSFKDKRTSTTTTTTSTTSAPLTTEEVVLNGTQGRSSGISSKNKVIVLDDKSLLPREYKQQENGKKIQPEDNATLLSTVYTTEKVPEVIKNGKKDLLDKIQKVDITAFLPKGFKLNVTTTEKPKQVKSVIKQVDISAFLPPGFHLNKTENESEKDLLSIFKVADVSSLLPPGFKQNKTEEFPPSPTQTRARPPAPGGIKLVFPSRPGSAGGGSRPGRITTPRPAHAAPPSPVTPKIQKGWPTRASTEFTGWPSPSTTPFSIDALLAARSEPPAPAHTDPPPAAPTSTPTPTTSSTAAPVVTTAGVCRRDCELAATVKLVGGARWQPELLDAHTHEWRALAHDVREELNSVYSRSELLARWYRGVRIDGFSPGSVLVDYFVELADLAEPVDTLRLRDMFHRELAAGSTPPSARPPQPVDDGMQGDQPAEAHPARTLQIGKFLMDPAYTEFIVLPKHSVQAAGAGVGAGVGAGAGEGEEAWLPQWGIAVIVIALASLLFVVIFGVTVLVNRQKSAKAKAPIPLSEDMLRELDKSHMGGDDTHTQGHPPCAHYNSSKRMSAAFLDQLSGGGGGVGGVGGVGAGADSWRSEWTPALHHYMQQQEHHVYGGSQLYGVGGGGSLYGGGWGGGGEYPPAYPPARSHRSRRRSDIDTNF